MRNDVAHSLLEKHHIFQHRIELSFTAKVYLTFFGRCHGKSFMGV